MPNLHLCDLDLNKNALLNPVIHPVGSAPTNPVEGQIYYDNTGGDKQIYVWNGTGWGSMGGDITGVTFIADGGSNLVTESGAVSLDIAGGTGITTAATAGTITVNLDAGLIADGSNITSLGTLDALVVDNVSINGNSVFSTTSSLYLTPTAGSDIVLDGTIHIDGGAVTGATSITSTAFVGALTGNASGSAGTVTNIGNLTGDVTSVNRVTTIATGAVVTAKLASNAVTAAKITDANVTNAKLASNAVTTVKILDANVTNAKLATSAVSTVKLASNSVTTAKITDANVTTAKLANGAATAAKIGSNAVTTSKINDAAVTMAKLANIATDTFIGRTAAGSGVPKALSKTEALAILNVADGAGVNVDTNVDIATLTTRLGQLTENVTIGDASDVQVTIAGNLIVQGTTTTIDSTNLNLEDHNIILDSNNVSGAVVNGAGITIEGGSGDDATFTYNTSGPKFEMKLGSAYEDLKVDTLHAATLVVTDYGLASGDIPSNAADTTGTATKANTLNINEDNSGDTSCSILFTQSAGTGYRNVFEDAGLTYDNTDNILTTTTFNGNLTGNVTGNVTGTASLVAVANSNSNDAFPIVFHNESDGLLDDTAAFEYNPYSGKAYIPQIETSSVIQLGHASDTTIARSAAGRVTIGGQQIATSKKFALAHATTDVVGNNSGTNDTVFTITHGMGDQLEYMVQVIAASGGATVFPCVTRTTATVVITFNAAAAQSAYTALLVKI